MREVEPISEEEQYSDDELVESEEDENFQGNSKLMR